MCLGAFVSISVCQGACFFTSVGVCVSGLGLVCMACGGMVVLGLRAHVIRVLGGWGDGGGEQGSTQVCRPIGHTKGF